MADVNVKMGVSGVAQFKQSMNQAKQAAKTLDAQLALTEKEFKATGDAEDYMTKKTEELKAKLEAQKSVVENAQHALDAMAKNGVDKSSTAYQKLYQEMLKAKGEMLDTENALNGITDATDAAADGVSEMNGQLANIGQGISWQNVTSGLEGIVSKLEKAGQTAWNFGKKLVNATLGAGEWADQLATEAKTMGLSTDDLQRMRYTSNIIDTSVEAIISAKKRLKKERAGESEETMGAFAALGIDPSQTKDAEDLFWRTGEALMKLGDEYNQEAYAQKLFGRSWNELIPLFEAGRKEYEETNASWDVLSDDQIESLTKMDDEYQKLNSQFETLKMKALSEFAEPMEKAMESINGLLKDFTDWLESEDGQKFVDGVITALTEGLNWIVEHKEDVVTALGAIAAGFALIKITTLAANIGKFVTGLSGVFGGKAAAEAAQAAGTGTTAASSGIGMSGALGIGGAAAIIAGSIWAADRRKNHAEEVRGTDENMAAKSSGVEQALANFILANQAMSKLLPDDSAETWEKTAEWLAKAQETLNNTEGGMEALQAYSDWRQENSYGNMDWELPDNLVQAVQELTGGTEAQKQSNSEMTEAASGLKGLPAETAEAVRQSLNGAQVRIDGERLSAYVGEVFAQWIANQGSP